MPDDGSHRELLELGEQATEEHERSHKDILGTVLVCLDGTELAESILPYAIAEARYFDSEMVLLRVIESPVSIDPGRGLHPVAVETTGIKKEVEAESDKAQAYLRKIAERLAAEDIKAETAVLPGEPDVADAIFHYAKDNDFGLVALATHGRSGAPRAFSGSITDSLMRMSTPPMLVVNPQASAKRDPVGRFENMLVCLDGSERAEQIIPFAAEHGLHMRTRLHLLRAARRQERHAAERYLDAVAARLRDRGLEVTSAVVKGEAGAAIIKRSAESAIDIIAMTTRGRSGLTRALFGSVADHVIRRSGLPVLLVTPPHESG